MASLRIAVRVLAVAVVAVAGAACGGDDDTASPVTVDPDAPTTTSEPTTKTETTTTAADPRAAVEQAFYDQWDAFVEILSDPDPANPLIDRYFTGEAKEALLDTISSDVAKGHVTRRPDDPADFSPSVESIEMVDSTTATVIECTVDGLVVLNEESQEVVNDNVATYRLENTFVLVGQQWKLSTNSAAGDTGEDVTCT